MTQDILLVCGTPEDFGVSTPAHLQRVDKVQGAVPYKMSKSLKISPEYTGHPMNVKFPILTKLDPSKYLKCSSYTRSQTQQKGRAIILPSVM